MKKAVAVVIENEKGEILLNQRGKTSKDEFNKWENCGGSVEEGETAEEAVIREVLEEIGCKLTIKSVLFTDIFVTDGGFEWEVTLFSGTIEGEPVIQNNENMAVKWFAKNDLVNVDLASYTKNDFKRFGWI